MKRTLFVLVVIMSFILANQSFAQNISPGSGPNSPGYYGRGYYEDYYQMPGMCVGLWSPPRGPQLEDYRFYGNNRWGKQMTAVCEKFLDDTAALRRDYLLNGFQLDEAFRKPATQKETLQKLLAQQLDLDHKIHEKNVYGCWW